MAEHRNFLQSLRNEFHAVHRAFLEALKYRFERAEGKALNPSQWWILLSQDPAYQWARPFTQLAAQMDELLDEENLSEGQVSEIHKKVEEHFSLESAFGRRFFEMIPHEPDLMMSFHRLRQVRKEWPPQDKKAKN